MASVCDVGHRRKKTSSLDHSRLSGAFSFLTRPTKPNFSKHEIKLKQSCVTGDASISTFAAAAATDHKEPNRPTCDGPSHSQNRGFGHVRELQPRDRGSASRGCSGASRHEVGDRGTRKVPVGGWSRTPRQLVLHRAAVRAPLLIPKIFWTVTGAVCVTRLAGVAHGERQTLCSSHRETHRR